MSRCAWPCCGRSSAREGPLSEAIDRARSRAGASSTRPGRTASPTCASSTASIAEVGPGLDAAAGATVLDAEGCVVAPGLVDIQVHFREPGREDSGDDRDRCAGGRARRLHRGRVHAEHRPAARRRRGRAGGARTRPRGRLCDVRAARAASPRAARGEELAPLGELYDLGVRVFTDDGDCVADARVMRHAFEYATALPGAVLAQHAEDPALVARRAHARRGVVGAARDPGPARGGRVDDRRTRPARSRAAPAGATTCCTCRPRASAALVRDAKADGVRVTAECTPQHFTLTDEACASFDPVFKMNPPLRDADRRRRAAAPRSLDGTIDAIATDHAPHTAGDEGRAVRGGAAGHARRRDRARGRAHDARRTRACSRSQQALAALSWQPARDRRPRRRRARRPDRAGPRRAPVRDRSRAHLGRSTAPGSRAGRATRRSTAGSSPARSATPSAAANPIVRDGEANEMIATDRIDAAARERARRCAGAKRCTARLRALLVLADGETFEGVAVGYRARRRRGGGRGRVQHRARAATRRSSPTRRTRARSSRSPTRTSATTASTPDDDEARVPHCRGRDRARPRAPAVELARDRRSRRVPAPSRVAGHRRHRHPPPHPPHPRARARSRARSAPPTATRCSPPRRPTAAPTAATSRPTVTTAGAVHGRARRRGLLRRRVRLRDQAFDPRPARRRPAARSRWCPRARRRADGARPRTRRRVPVERSRRPGRGRRRGRENVQRAARQRAGVRHLPRPPDHGPRARRATRSSCASATTAATIRCAQLATGRVEITSQNHNYAVDADDAARRASRSRTSTSTTATSKACAAERPRRVPVQYHPEAGPGPHDARYLFDEFVDLMRGELSRMPAATTSRRSCSSAAGRSSSGRRASSTTRARRRAGCCATRATASCS